MQCLKSVLEAPDTDSSESKSDDRTSLDSKIAEVCARSVNILL